MVRAGDVPADARARQPEEDVPAVGRLLDGVAVVDIAAAEQLLPLDGRVLTIRGGGAGGGAEHEQHRCREEEQEKDSGPHETYLCVWMADRLVLEAISVPKCPGSGVTGPREEKERGVPASQRWVKSQTTSAPFPSSGVLHVTGCIPPSLTTYATLPGKSLSFKAGTLRIWHCPARRLDGLAETPDFPKRRQSRRWSASMSLPSSTCLAADIMAVNSAAARLSNLRVVGLSMIDLVQQSSSRRSDGSRLLPGDLPYMRALRGEVVDQGERIDIVLPEGSVYQAVVTSSPVIRDGKVVAALSVWHDFNAYVRDLAGGGSPDKK